MPGVHSVITAADLGSPVPTVTIRLQPMPSLVPFQQPVMAHGKVRYVGEPIALVLADSVAIAEDAANAIEVDIDPLPAITDRHASARDETLLFERHGSNQPVKYTAVLGDATAAFRNAPYIRREQFRVNRHAAVPDGAARPARRMGREQRPADAAWRGQGRVLQSPHAGGEARACRRQGRSRRERCRRRLRRARRVLSGGFPHSVRRAVAPAVRSSGPRIAART